MLCPIAGVICLEVVSGEKIEPYECGGAAGTYRLLFGLSLAVLCCYLSAGMNDSNDGTRLTLALLKEERP